SSPSQPPPPPASTRGISRRRRDEDESGKTDEDSRLANRFLTDPLNVPLTRAAINSMRMSKLFSNVGTGVTSVNFDRFGKRCAITTRDESIHIFNCVTGL
ncbi:hypothetical protein EV182_008835, partial [Spiromyces aspiralis]